MSTGKEVAVKKLRVQTLDDDIMEQFVKEVQIMSQLRHVSASQPQKSDIAAKHSAIYGCMFGS